MAAREMGHVDPIIIPKGNGPATDTTNTSTDDATSTRDTDILHQYLDAPPSLEYSVASRKWKIIFFWTVVTFDSVAMPIALYFALWYGTDLSPNAVFSIVTAAIGGISIWEYAARLWALWKKDSTCRPIGAERKHLDWFHWCFTAMWVVVMAELIIGTCFEHPPIRVLSMPLATVVWTFGTELLIIDGLRLLGIPNLFRISSLPKGAQQRPGIYNIIEDIIAVDGGGGTEYRKRLSVRYEASHTFRQMLHRLTLFWAFGAEATAILCTILIFTLDSHDAVFSLGWSVPFVWAGIWALMTWWYVERCLKYERENWTRNPEIPELESGPTALPDVSEVGTGTTQGDSEKIAPLPRRSSAPRRSSVSHRPVHSLEHVKIRTSLSGARPSMSADTPRKSIDRTRISTDLARNTAGHGPGVTGDREVSYTRIDTEQGGLRKSSDFGRRKSSGAYLPGKRYISTEPLPSDLPLGNLGAGVRAKSDETTVVRPDATHRASEP